ncbi:hypothetical protein CPB86DRAFT_722854 [Serendipita vermifera]|nr:hypothetical protein CPB86DRAFT_722854 [Serendipita vermifera]
MLERRLIWSTTGTKALKSVALPGNTPRRLLRLVCEILQGQLADRPSNFDLSLSEKISIFLDTTILDCIVCISSGAKCSFPSPSINPGLELIQRMITRAKDLPIYPENEEDILRSWEARAKVFEDVLNLSRFRNDNCDIFLHPVKLDQFSCVDVDF